MQPVQSVWKQSESVGMASASVTSDNFTRHQNRGTKTGRSSRYCTVILMIWKWASTWLSLDVGSMHLAIYTCVGGAWLQLHIEFNHTTMGWEWMNQGKHHWGKKLKLHIKQGGWMFWISVYTWISGLSGCLLALDLTCCDWCVFKGFSCLQLSAREVLIIQYIYVVRVYKLGICKENSRFSFGKPRTELIYKT